MSEQLNKKGFTLIEVVLVLAIGGLIFLLAFIAFQQVSRNRRDTQRRADAGRVVAELDNYKADAGAYPAATSADEASGSGTSPFGLFITKYMGGSNFKDPQGAVYTWYKSGTTDAQFQALQPTNYLGIPLWPAQYRPDTKCSGSNFLSSSTTTGLAAVRIKLETGIICRDNS